MFELTKGEVYEFYLKDDNYKLFSKTELSEIILLKCGLDIKSEEQIEQLQKGAEIFSTAARVIDKRLHKLLQSIQSKRKGFSLQDPRRNEVFFDLRDFPELIAEEVSQNLLSQSSTASRTSDVSDLEIDIPSRPKIKRSFPFSEVGPKAKTLRTKGVYDLLLETAQKENLPPEKLIAYLGYRVCYQNNKKLAHRFKDIWEDRQLADEVKPSQALYIREHCQIGRSIYTGTNLMFLMHA